MAEAGHELVLQVHDELVLDGRVEKEELVGLGLEALGMFPTPIDVKWHGRWQ